MTVNQAIHTLPAHEVFAALRSRPKGLTTAEASERLREHGPNALVTAQRKPALARLFAQFTHLMALLLWVAGAMAVLAKMPQLGLAICMVNLINGAFSFWQEYKADKAAEALQHMLPAHVRVLRNGEEAMVAAPDLVPGDVTLLAEGDRVSADARLVQDAELRVDQSTFTGEPQPVRKSCEVQLNHAPGHEIQNLVLAGTNIVAGTGKAVVVATGMHTAFGQIAHLTQSLGEELSPLQREMQKVTRQITAIALIAGAIFFLAAVLFAKLEVLQGFVFAIGMIVAFVPEGLLPTVTLALAMGTQRMARRHALIRRLSAVETLGCTTVICTDKTGTLTQNEMTVRDIWMPAATVKITGVGYAPVGDLVCDGALLDLQTPAGRDLSALLTAACLCNDAALLAPRDGSAQWTVLGDPTEAALLVAGRKAGLDVDVATRRATRVRELPFDSRRKRMSTIHSNAEPRVQEQIAYVKGAPREILALCTDAWCDGASQPLSELLRDRALEANDAFARDGLRVLAVARRELCELSPKAGLSQYSPDTIERNLTLLGLVAMMDPPRPEVAAAIKTCHRAGIRVVMITGDYGLTAESIARRIGIVRGAQPTVISGSQLEEMDDTALRLALAGDVIFARVAPQDKLRVVSALQAMGHVVAVTGDGVNDAPALKKADIGVAMGLSGTDVAKDAADMILTDDNFASIVDAIEEGRTVYTNIRKFTTYIFTSNTPEAVPFVLFALSQGRIPLALNVMHVLAVDLGTDIMPALALGAEPPEPGLMDRPPRRLNEHVITRGLLLRAYVWLGIVQSLAAMSAFYFVYWMNGYAGQWLDLPGSGTLYQAATAMALSAVVTTQIGNLFAQRLERQSVFAQGLRHFAVSRLIWIGIATELALIVGIVYLPPLQALVGTAAFPPAYWLFLFAWMPALLLVDEARKRLGRRRTANANTAGQGVGMTAEDT